MAVQAGLSITFANIADLFNIEVLFTWIKTNPSDIMDILIGKDENYLFLSIDDQGLMILDI